MRKRQRPRFIPFQLKKQWGVLDRTTGELVERAKKVERYPQTWARTRADQLNAKKEVKDD